MPLKSCLDATRQLEPEAVDDEELRLGELLVVAGRGLIEMRIRRCLRPGSRRAIDLARPVT